MTTEMTIRTMMTVMFVFQGAIVLGILLLAIFNWVLRSGLKRLVKEATRGSKIRGEALDWMKMDRNGEVQLPEVRLFEFMTLLCDWKRLRISKKTCWEVLERKMCEACLIKEWAEEKLREHHRKTGR